MHFLAQTLSLLAAAAAVSGTPTAPGSLLKHDVADSSHEFIDHVVFKRGQDLHARDEELAKQHGVDLNTMYRHSLFRRADGDDVTIWVHNSYVEKEEAQEGEKANEGSLDARQVRVGDRFNSVYSQNLCGDSTFYGHTTSSSPFTGGANAIMAWANGREGGFRLEAWCCWDPVRVNLLVAGTNSGANMRFSAGKNAADRDVEALVGNRDIYDITRDARNRFQKNYGGWRVAASGGMRCLGHLPRPWVNWVIDRSSQTV